MFQHRSSPFIGGRTVRPPCRSIDLTYQIGGESNPDSAPPEGLPLSFPCLSVGFGVEPEAIEFEELAVERVAGHVLYLPGSSSGPERLARTHPFVAIPRSFARHRQPARTRRPGCSILRIASRLPGPFLKPPNGFPCLSHPWLCLSFPHSRPPTVLPTPTASLDGGGFYLAGGTLFVVGSGKALHSQPGGSESSWNT